MNPAVSDRVPPTAAASRLGAVHLRRLRQVWHSAGWPYRDVIEIELLAAGLLQRVGAGEGRDLLRVTDAGIAVLAETLEGNRARRDAHERLVERVAGEMLRTGRIVWRGLSLRARVAEGWVMAMPDVYSIRHTTLEHGVHPVVHEIKVHRADLLADLRRPAKAEAYRRLSSECWYVLGPGVGSADEIPPPYGVMGVAPSGGLEVARPAPQRAMVLPLSTWMALARAAPLRGDDDAQWPLCEVEPAGDDPAGSAGE